MRVATLPVYALLLVLALLAAGCGGDDKDAKDATDGKSDRAAEAFEPDETFTIQVEDAKVLGGAQVLKAAPGDAIRIAILSDADDEVHLHGFDVQADVERGMPATLDVTAKDPGSYDLEFHGSGLVVGTLQVS